VRAAVLYGTNEPFRVEDVDLDEPGPGEVCVRLHASGVCRSDWATATGEIPSPLPAVLGHEGAGLVEAVGPGVESVRPGDRVVLSWLPFCGRCFYCLQARPSLCEAAMEFLLAGTLLDGAVRLSRNGERIHHYSFLSTFAERTIVPEKSCVPIRADVPLEVAALVGCAVMTGIGAVVNRAQVRAGSTVLVFGAGGVGLSVVQGARIVGAANVVAVDPVESKRSLAAELGATHTLDPGSDDPLEVVRELTHGRGADYAFEAAGRPALVRQAFDALRRGGTLVCIGIGGADTEVHLPGPRLVREEKVVTGSLYGSCRPHLDIPLVLDLYAEGRLALDRLVSKTYALDEINTAFEDLQSGEVARGVISLNGAA
jgi:NDMA-dependent alcohol dehydrogenase